MGQLFSWSWDDESLATTWSSGHLLRRWRHPNPFNSGVLAFYAICKSFTCCQPSSNSCAYSALREGVRGGASGNERHSLTSPAHFAQTHSSWPRASRAL